MDWLLLIFIIIAVLLSIALFSWFFLPALFMWGLRRFAIWFGLKKARSFAESWRERRKGRVD